ncbi:MAG TPA: hypothetical protein VNO31_25235 [Umezawaea sp.]|nr:hypothetical protein [Umezawaea sp.]
MPLTAGCGSSDGATADPDTVAVVSDEPITVDEVRALVRDDPLPPVRIAGRRYADPWREALDRAIRDELLAREAARRGITAPTRAEQVAALVEQEERVTDDLVVETIDDQEVRAWFAEHLAEVGAVERADVVWAQLTDGRLARELLGRLEGSDPETFLRVVRENGVTASGAATVHADGEEGADPMVIRAAFATAVTGGVGLAEDPQNGRWWLARVGAISFEPVNWDPETTFTIKSTMADHREQEHLSRLADGLRERWPVRLFEDRIAEMVDRKAPS